MTWPDKARWQVLSPWIDRLLELDAGRRAARLAQIRVQDAVLADDLERLLDEQSSADRDAFLDGSMLVRGPAKSG